MYSQKTEYFEIISIGYMEIQYKYREYFGIPESQHPDDPSRLHERTFELISIDRIRIECGNIFLDAPRPIPGTEFYKELESKIDDFENSN